MEQVNPQIMGLINFLLVLIPIAGAARIVYCLIAMSGDSDEEKSYQIRMRNVLVFTVIAEGVIGIWKTMVGYFV